MVVLFVSADHGMALVIHVGLDCRTAKKTHTLYRRRFFINDVVYRPMLKSSWQQMSVVPEATKRLDAENVINDEL